MTTMAATNAESAPSRHGLKYGPLSGKSCQEMLSAMWKRAVAKTLSPLGAAVRPAVAVEQHSRDLAPQICSPGAIHSPYPPGKVTGTTVRSWFQRSRAGQAG